MKWYSCLLKCSPWQLRNYFPDFPAQYLYSQVPFHYNIHLNFYHAPVLLLHLQGNGTLMTWRASSQTRLTWTVMRAVDASAMNIGGYGLDSCSLTALAASFTKSLPLCFFYWFSATGNGIVENQYSLFHSKTCYILIQFCISWDRLINRHWVGGRSYRFSKQVFELFLPSLSTGRKPTDIGDSSPTDGTFNPWDLSFFLQHPFNVQFCINSDLSWF